MDVLRSTLIGGTDGPDAEVQRLTTENGHLRRALEYGNDTYVLAMAADRDAWKRRAERWKTYAQLIRAQAMFDFMCNRTRWHGMVKRYRRMQAQGHPWARR